MPQISKGHRRKVYSRFPIDLFHRMEHDRTSRGLSVNDWMVLAASREVNRERGEEQALRRADQA